MLGRPTFTATPTDVDWWRGLVPIEFTLAWEDTRRLWDLLHDEAYVRSLGAMTENHTVQMIQAGLKTSYPSGWQIATDANPAGENCPGRSLYPSNIEPSVDA